MDRNIALLGGLLLSVIASIASGQENFFQASILPTREDNFYEANSRLWLPDNAEKIAAVIIFLGGTDADARSSVMEKKWQDFARRENLALVGCHFRGDGESYEMAAGGSGQALLQMVNLLSEHAGRKEITEAPLVLVGYSSGAMFSYNFACWKPDRLLGFVSIKSGPIARPPDSTVYSIPALFIVGEFDLTRRLHSVVDVFAEAAEVNGLWGLALEPNGTHSFPTQLWPLICVYLEDILSSPFSKAEATQRYKAGVLRQLAVPKKNLSNKAPLNQDLVWLPGIASARQWQDFVKPTSLAAIAASGVSEQESEPARLSTLDFGQIDNRAASSVTKIFSVNVPTRKSGFFFLSNHPALSVKILKEDAGKCEIELHLKTRQVEAGIFRSNIMVHGASPKPIVIPIEAQIFSGYSSYPASLYVGVLPRNTRMNRTVTIKSDSEEAFRILEIQSSNPKFARAEIAQKQQGKDISLSCEFDGSEALGNQSGYFDILVSKSPRSTVRIPFIAWVSK